MNYAKWLGNIRGKLMESKGYFSMFAALAQNNY